MDPSSVGFLMLTKKKTRYQTNNFKIPLELLALPGKILCKRYVYGIGNRHGFHVEWIDQDKHNTELKITNNPDLTKVPTSLPCDELYKSKIQVN